MNKICINLYVPALESSYNVFVPENQNVKLVIISLNKLVHELSFKYFPITNDLSLVDATTGNIFDINKTVKENNILNNSTLILM